MLSANCGKAFEEFVLLRQDLFVVGETAEGDRDHGAFLLRGETHFHVLGLRQFIHFVLRRHEEFHGHIAVHFHDHRRGHRDLLLAVISAEDVACQHPETLAGALRIAARIHGDVDEVGPLVGAHLEAIVGLDHAVGICFNAAHLALGPDL